MEGRQIALFLDCERQDAAAFAEVPPTALER